MKICGIEDCNNKHMAKGYCCKHYSKYRQYGDPLKVVMRPKYHCKVDDCPNKHHSKGYCVIHYHKMIRSNNPPCKIEDCDQPRVGRGYCQKHYKRFNKYGDPLKTLKNQNPPKLCTIEGCNNPHDAKGMCNSHYMKEYTQNRRKTVISHYSQGGNCCECCGEDMYQFLTLDHINNDGAEHRKQIGGSHELVDWIIKNNYPAEFQILCQNCNVGKARNNGICPHKV